MSPLIICPRRFEDSRGWFSETWNDARLKAAGVDVQFRQDNQSLSRAPGTVRGLHFQAVPHAQAKLVRSIRGRVFDVAVDIRRQSPTFGQWAGVELSADNGKQLLIPTGYAHGFMTLEPNCEIAYKVDDYYAADCEGGIAWDDPAIGIDWPVIDSAPVLSDKDAILRPLSSLTVEFPYDGNPLGPLREIAI
ncbi:dTDP-4-dehydrorhamnose 3,5-epimerase [Sphingomonas asaccharolytica]|uniref:dTDP-4-dehydrorhamnose 3,5-epimerase n=1 Tax=Sphingomonas asaccharolytica TaxID=40681 RepID=UPI00082B7490|nr:dTDP-4-dehydrorhamnose 3,5-epimerase [Sphingomonas asaccharolytica]